MELKIIAAVGKNNELGKDNTLIWPIKEDLKFFKNVTTGHTVIMGSNTFYSLPKVLPNRTNIVLSRKNLVLPEGVILYHNIDEFLNDYKDKDEIVFVIGGGSIYRLFIDKANEIYLTEIDKECREATVYFPEFDKELYDKEILSENIEEDINYKHVLYRKK